MPHKKFFLISKGGPLGIFNKKFFFAWFDLNMLSLSIFKLSDSKFGTKQAKKLKKKIPKGPPW